MEVVMPLIFHRSREPSANLPRNLGWSPAGAAPTVARRMIKSLTTMSAALGAAVALGISASPAAATTYHHTHTYLHFPARSTDAKAISTRVITLDGWYYWRAFSAHWAHANHPAASSRTVHLSGRYVWLDYLRVQGRTYRHWSVLRNARTGGQVTLSHEEPGRAGDGSYHWGSTLVNARSGTTNPSHGHT
jgi:hypothetical protein